MLRDSVLTIWMTTEPHEAALPQLVGLFDDREAEEDTLILDEGIQFNSWLFGKDIPIWIFIVEPNQQNKNTIPNLCEFSGSFSDCVIFHAKSFYKNSTVFVSALANNCDS